MKRFKKIRKKTVMVMLAAVLVVQAPVLAHAGILDMFISMMEPIYSNLVTLMDMLINRTPDTEMSLLNEALGQTDDGEKVWWDSVNRDKAMNAYRLTDWSFFQGLDVSLVGHPEMKAQLSEDMEPYVEALEAAAQEHGFAAYQELFKAIAQYRHETGDPDIFRIEDTGLNPNPGSPVSTEDSINIAAELFRDCVEAANFPNPMEKEDVKALLQAFEFERPDYIEFCNNKYSVESAEEFAKGCCDGMLREDAATAAAMGRYNYRDQKFPDKVLKFYTVIYINSANVPANIQQLITEVTSGWPSDMEEGRQKVIEKGLSLYGKVQYSMSQRLQPTPENPQYLDCSSFVGWSFYFAGFTDVPYSWATGGFVSGVSFHPIDRSQLKPGDIGLKNTVAEGGSNHVGIYMGKSASGADIWLHCTTMSSSGVVYNGITVDAYSNFAVFYRYNGWQ